MASIIWVCDTSYPKYKIVETRIVKLMIEDIKILRLNENRMRNMKGKKIGLKIVVV